MSCIIFSGVDLLDLEEKLQKYASRPLKIGSFSAASNVTGVLAEVDAITVMLHQHGALAFWDYAAAGPYVHIDMNPVMPSVHSSGATEVSALDRSLLYKDAVFLSPHKFIGGPGASGVLVAKKKLFNNAVPSTPGGGTVFYVTDKQHRYLSNREEREEGGTPDIMGSIRAGLAFHLKQRVGAENIMALEQAHTALAHKLLDQHPRICLLGNPDAPHLPILSFLIRAPSFVDVDVDVDLLGGGDSSSNSDDGAVLVSGGGPSDENANDDDTTPTARFLHYNYVCALLNDLYGVQCRGGCMCAGPYAQVVVGRLEK